MTLPVLQLSGPAHEQGVRHGKELRDRVAENLRIYFHRFETEGRLGRGEVLSRASAYGPVIERATPDYFAGMAGIAEGSGFSLEEILALNVRYEILYHQFGANAQADGCTSFSLSPAVTSNGHLLIGQNWDWIPQVLGAVLVTREPDGLKTLSFTEAGIFGGKIGFNSRGLGLAVNGMTSTSDDWARLRTPFHVRCHRILRSPDLDGALEAIGGEPRACSANFLIASGDRSVDVETAPDSLRVLDWVEGKLAHTNHFFDPDALGVAELPIERLGTRHRLKRIRELLAGGASFSPAHLQSFLRDHDGHPDSVCRHEDPAEAPDERYRTVTSIIIDLDDRTALITDGPPCENDYREVSLDSF